MGFSFDISDMMRLPQALEKLANTVQSREIAAVGLAGEAYKADVQSIIAYKSGTLRRSVHVEPSSDGGRPVSMVGSNAPYARRIEYGFWDMTDVLGRHFYQYPRPAWRPAFDANKAKYGQIMADYMAGKSRASYSDYGAEKRADVAMFTAQAEDIIAGRM